MYLYTPNRRHNICLAFESVANFVSPPTTIIFEANIFVQRAPSFIISWINTKRSKIRQKLYKRLFSHVMHETLHRCKISFPQILLLSAKTTTCGTRGKGKKNAAKQNEANPKWGLRCVVHTHAPSSLVVPSSSSTRASNNVAYLFGRPEAGGGRRAQGTTGSRHAHQWVW